MGHHNCFNVGKMELLQSLYLEGSSFLLSATVIEPQNRFQAGKTENLSSFVVYLAYRSSNATMYLEKV